MELKSLLVVIIISFILGRTTIPAVIKLCYKYDFLDMPGHHKRHRKPTPFLGGVALFVVIWLTVIAYLIFSGVFSQELGGSILYIFLGAMIIFLVGLSDDLAPVSAWIKLLAQVAAGLVLYMGGLKIDPVSIPYYGQIAIGQYSVLITVLWVVLLTNAVNLIDGLDGLAAGVSLIGIVTMVIIGHLYHLGPVMVFAYAMIGFLVVFLYYNRYPARIFLGDSGSLQIGYYFAVISLLVPVRSYTAAALYVPLLALGVPLLETVISFTRRLIAGKNVMKADRRHIFHYLTLAGLSYRWVVLVFYALSVIFGLFALAMFYVNRLKVFGFLVLFMVVIFTLFFIFMTNLNRFRKKRL
ncbi:MAG: undecaprenyl/decaprenyl-phosphate alpha-N-acetylglucosaminyl 1-phosphate transferase [candidate division Zixibacteria bacterium]|nr:undecaprenyl/decaprenyl-phosphate alpha-N-acetylglucosaminyl 1-phosphate transferase [candidate division Zixibacteria bacterium]